jgi:Flp pilus assembly protein TadB
MLQLLLSVLLNAPGDIPGSSKRKVNAILVSIGLTMVTAIILFSNLPPLVALAIITFVCRCFRYLVLERL